MEQLPSIKISYKIQRTNSTRKNQPDSLSWHHALQDMLYIVRELFSFSWEKGLFYGSWGGFYSIFPILITNQNQIVIYDKYKDIFLWKTGNGVFKTLLKCYLYTEGNDFSLFPFHIILASAYEGVLNKYGNRGYRYLQMEAGAIGTLIRQMCGNMKIPQLEVQGYEDKKIWQLLKNYIDFQENKGLILHLIACG